MLDLGPDQLRGIIAKMIVFILSIAVHEFGHAFVADRLGDGVPRAQGRVTLNPFAHADPIGTLALPAIGLLLSGGGGFGFGWGRPVQVNPAAFSRRFSIKTGHLLVAAAGPAMNILFGVLISVLLVVLLKTRVLENMDLAQMLSDAVYINFLLAFFNLLPAPPLDGGTVLVGLLPDRFQAAFHRFSQYSIFVIMLVIMTKLRILFIYPTEMLHHYWFSALLGGL